MRYLPIVFLIFSMLGPDCFCQGQKKIVVMGSSTAEGDGASSTDSSWAGRLQAYFRKNKSTTDPDTTVINIAHAGYDTYKEMPTGFKPPSGRPAPDPDHNITKALSYAPDVLLINLPSNDVANGYTKKEIMSNFNLLYQTALARAVKCFITTTQPRNDLDDAGRRTLLDLTDSITFDFGPFSIDFWDDLVTSDGTNRLRDDVRYPPSDYHLNDKGHRLVFETVVQKNIFASGTILPLPPVCLTATQTNNSIVLTWNAGNSAPETNFEVERSADNIQFTSLSILSVQQANPPGIFTWTDRQPLPANSFYRLKITTQGETSYSNTIAAYIAVREFTMQVFNQNTTQLTVGIHTDRNRQVTLRIISASGAVLYQSVRNITVPVSQIVLPVVRLASGAYFITAETNDGKKYIQQFFQQ